MEERGKNAEEAAHQVRPGPLRILVLYWHPKGSEMLLAVRQHMHLLEGRGLRILYHNAIDPAPPWLAWTAPDMCVLHTTFLCVRWHFDFEDYRRRFRWVSALRCPKVALPQDEYDHAELLDEWLLELGVTSVYSCFGPDKWKTLYPRVGQQATVYETLAGFIDEQAAAELAPRIVPHAKRPYDIVYRARNLPYWFGSHGQLKHRIAEVVQQAAGRLGLSTDISTRAEDTVYGDRWLDFLMSGRAVVGAESGSSVRDARGEIQRRISRLVAEQPSLTFEEVDAQMPAGWDSYAFFAISPRHLEAVITKTAQVLVEGGYSGVLKPHRHYIPLRRDFSNLDDALAKLQDVEAIEAMTERAYRDVYLSGVNNLSVLADQLHAEAGTRQERRLGLPLALGKAPVPPVRRLTGMPLRHLIAFLLTLGEALTVQQEARTLLIAGIRGRLAVALRDVVRELILLRILGRIREEVDGGRGAWSLAIESTNRTTFIRTGEGASVENGRRLDRFPPLELLVWTHEHVAVPIYPRHRRWGWIRLGQYGRYEFPLLTEVRRTDARTARALLARTLGDEKQAANETSDAAS